MKRKQLIQLTAALCAALVPVIANAADQKPNIVVIWGDDIGLTDVSAYSQGLLGFKTPNIDRIAREGILFTDYYGEQSCTAGRSSFITCQYGLHMHYQSGSAGCNARAAEGR